MLIAKLLSKLSQEILLRRRSSRPLETLLSQEALNERVTQRIIAIELIAREHWVGRFPKSWIIVDNDTYAGGEVLSGLMGLRFVDGSSGRSDGRQALLSLSASIADRGPNMLQAIQVVVCRDVAVGCH